jgi:MFS family permease
MQGVPPVSAAAVLTVAGVAMFVGRLASGVILDRYFAPRVTAGITLLSILGLALLVIETEGAMVYVAAALLGLGLGSEMDAAAYLTSRAFGQRSFGAIYGSMTLAYGLASAIGPATVGALLSSGVEPSLIFLVCLALLIPAFVLVLSLRPRSFPFGGVGEQHDGEKGAAHGG